MLPEPLDPADLIKEQRAELEELLADLTERSSPLTAAEARLLISSTSLCLALLDEHLPRPAAPVPPSLFTVWGWKLRHKLARVRSWFEPRIGRLHHYIVPQPLEVPTRYLRVVAPDPAPTISIVTPSFEQGRFIERTLRSVLDQSYPALEYFVQDGGSTDGTLETLRRYERDLAGWVSEPDEGQADAINRAFARTTGEVMAWLNSDDLLLPGSLAYVANYFATHPDVDVVYGNRVMIDDNDNRIGQWILPRHDDVALTLADYIPQETLFWRRRIWEAAGAGLDCEFGYALDWDVLLRFRSAGAKMVRLPRFIGAFRVHDEQKTSASHSLGLTETALLRERVHGRPLSNVEVYERLRPYFRRHVVLHTRQRIIDRLPLARVAVQIPPPRVLSIAAETTNQQTTTSVEPSRTSPGPSLSR